MFVFAVQNSVSSTLNYCEHPPGLLDFFSLRSSFAEPDPGPSDAAAAGPDRHAAGPAPEPHPEVAADDPPGDAGREPGPALPDPVADPVPEGPQLPICRGPSTTRTKVTPDGVVSLLEEQHLTLAHTCLVALRQYGWYSTAMCAHACGSGGGGAGVSDLHACSSACIVITKSSLVSSAY